MLEQPPQNNGAGVSLTSTTIQYAINVKAGSVLLIACRVGATGRTITVSDDINGAWTAGPTIAQSTDGHQTYLYAFVGSAGGSRPTVTFAISGVAATLRLAILEYSHAVAADQSNSAQSTGTAATVQATTTTPTEICIGVATHNNADGGLWTAGVGWKKLSESGGSGSCLLVEELIASSSSTYDHNPTCGGTNGSWTSLIWTFPYNIPAPQRSLKFVHLRKAK